MIIELSDDIKDRVFNVGATSNPGTTIDKPEPTELSVIEDKLTCKFTKPHTESYETNIVSSVDVKALELYVTAFVP